MLLMIGLAAGIVVGLLRGGDLFRLGELRGIWFAVLALALDTILNRLPLISIWPKALLTSGCYLCVLLFVFFNRKNPAATVLLSAGTLCNYAVKAANAFRMPISVKALSVYAGITDAGVRATRPDYFIAENGAKLLPLGDVIYIPFPWQRAFFSVGDFLIAAGVFLLVTSVMGKRSPAAPATAGTESVPSAESDESEAPADPPAEADPERPDAPEK